MAAAINLAALTFSADQLRDLNELILKAILTAPELSLFHTFVTGIRNDREIGLIPQSLGLIGKAAQGCDPVADILAVTAQRKLWEPKRIEVILDQCHTDIAASMAKLSRNLGIEIADLTNTDYFALLLDLLAKDIPKMILRHAWMGRTDAMSHDESPAGVLTSGTDEDYFNILNGFFYQMAVIYAADATRKTTISENAEATTALQFSTLSPADTLAHLNNVVDSAPAELSAQPDRMLLVTDSIFKRAYRSLQAAGLAYNIQLQTSGYQLLQWDGIPMYSIPLWDSCIRAYENNGEKLNNPHRIVYTTKSNLVIGMEGTSLFDNVNTFYDQKSRINRIEVSDAFDAKVLQDEIVQVGI